MKYLSDYMELEQTKAFNDHGAFFAFSSEQFNEQKKENVVYVSIGAGLIVPKDNAKTLINALDNITQAGREADIAENGIKAIIHRELGNHECQITGDCEIVIDLLKPYGITPEQVVTEWPLFFRHCVENDYF